MLGEISFAADQMIDRTRIKTHVFSEFVSKMAGSHSVKKPQDDLRGVRSHQIDFMHRNCEQLLKHGERMIETTSNLFANRLHN